MSGRGDGHYTVPTHSLGRVIVCGRCGAVISYDRRDLHDDFHDATPINVPLG
jgi:hypothetical protein